jgi:cell division protein FtsB
LDILFERKSETLKNEIITLKKDINKLKLEQDNIFETLGLNFSKYRFWLGNDLTRKYNSLLNEIIANSRIEIKGTEDVTTHEQQLRILDENRIDIFTLINSLNPKCFSKRSPKRS